MALAACVRPAMVDGKGMRSGIFRRNPGAGAVAGRAVREEQPGMVGRLAVA